MKAGRVWLPGLALLFAIPLARTRAAPPAGPRPLGREVSIAHHLADDDEFRIPLGALLAHGKALFMANWTREEGGGRPLAKGTGLPLSDPASPLVGERAFNRISGPDANSCAGCHNAPYGIPGGGGDFVTNVFVQAQRFDFIGSERPGSAAPTKNARDESLRPVTLDSVADSRSTTALFGAGYLEMLAREITADLQTIRDTVRPGDSKALVSKGIDFGRISRSPDGGWNVSLVLGLPRMSLLTSGPINPPSLIVLPWHQSGSVVSLREFSNNAFNQHHGIQSTERFGRDTDPDGDGVTNELTRADVTAVSIFQATLQVPGRVIPRDPEIEGAVWRGEQLFSSIGCSSCHVSKLPLTRNGWIYSEPNPFNPRGNLRAGDSQTLKVDLQSASLPVPRLHPAAPEALTIDVPAYTDFKLHDITTGPGDPNEEPIDMNWPSWTPGFRAGNRRFLTRRLWGAGNQPPYFHHGRFTTMREAILAHAGEALAERRRFEELLPTERDAIVEFLKTLQVLPPGTTGLIVDASYHARPWPPARN